jgi:very-short-patch-repair endonuclease
MNNYTHRKPPLPPELLQFARKLRVDQTDAESLMWAMLRNRRLDGHKFRRQHPCKPYILDFYCQEKQLVVELDGGQHNTEEEILHDKVRTRFLVTQGICVLRFWNYEVLEDTDTVLEAIWNALNEDEFSG